MRKLFLLLFGWGGNLLDQQIFNLLLNNLCTMLSVGFPVIVQVLAVLCPVLAVFHVSSLLGAGGCSPGLGLG